MGYHVEGLEEEDCTGFTSQSLKFDSDSIVGNFFRDRAKLFPSAWLEAGEVEEFHTVWPMRLLNLSVYKSHNPFQEFEEYDGKEKAISNW